MLRKATSVARAAPTAINGLFLYLRINLDSLSVKRRVTKAMSCLFELKGDVLCRCGCFFKHHASSNYNAI